MFLGLPDPDPSVRGRYGSASLLSSSKKSNKNLHSLCFFISDPDPVVRSVVPRIRIRTKMSRIPNTDKKVILCFCTPGKRYVLQENAIAEHSTFMPDDVNDGIVFQPVVLTWSSWTVSSPTTVRHLSRPTFTGRFICTYLYKLVFPYPLEV
jgi:hypothetical protein